jgi:hypothetical protein
MISEQIAEQLIERWAESNAPIHLHDVLGRLQEEDRLTEYIDMGCSCCKDIKNHDYKILWRWEQCGFKKSLQEILGEAEWEEKEILLNVVGTKPEYDKEKDEYHWKSKQEYKMIKVMKPSPIADLFEYLLTLFPDE